MRWRGCVPLTALLFLCVNLAPGAFAQGRRGAMGRVRPDKPARQVRRTPIEEFRTMSPDQQQRALDRLTPQERQRLQERLKKFDQLPAGQQRSLNNLYNRLHGLAPERQDAVRESINNFSRLPAPRQQAMREELRGMVGLSDKDRQARMSTPEFQEKFSKEEQGILRDMSEVLPPD